MNLNKIATHIILAVAAIISLQPLMSILNTNYGNYFYSPETIYIANQVKQLPDQNIYLYGASDLIYQLAEKLPPNNYYLPSLPWYLNYLPYQQKLLKSLISINTIIVDPDFTVDGQKLSATAPEVLRYIKMNYYIDSKIKNLEVYKLKNNESRNRY